MVMNRRDFVRAGLGWAAAAGTFCLPGRATRLLAQAQSANGAADEIDRWIATSHHARILGRPRSLAAVRQGFWPISPERVLILHPRPASSVERGMPDILRAAHLSFDLHTWPTDCSHYRHALDAGHRLSSQKLVLIGRITSALADHYGVPGLWEEWGHAMALRELLGSTYVGGNVAQPQQFQHDKVGGRTIQTDNDLVDHWLVLIPHGTRDWDGWRDNLSVHVMLTHIFEEPGRSVGLTSPVCVVSGSAVFSLVEPSRHWAFDSSPRVIELSRMDRLSAARLLNERFIAVAREQDEWVKQRS